MSRKVIVDADACPGKNIIIEVCHEADLPLILVASFAHEINAPSWVEVRKVDCYPQAVDMLVSNLTAAGDVVITQDWGLAAICLAKGAVCLAPDGKQYDDSRMMAMLEMRNASARWRRGGGRTRGPAARTVQDDLYLENSLRRVLGLPPKGSNGS
ncbi:MAG: YaiI/YqxD family protein [Bacillota bacterium]|jgi:uncharacterized protein YaiI (UPF0178 family)